MKYVICINNSWLEMSQSCNKNITFSFSSWCDIHRKSFEIYIMTQFLYVCYYNSNNYISYRDLC